jgi:hypothetical protein
LDSLLGDSRVGTLECPVLVACALRRKMRLVKILVSHCHKSMDEKIDTTLEDRDQRILEFYLKMWEFTVCKRMTLFQLNR